MNIPSFVPCGKVSLPSSKSYFHRYLISFFIANKKSSLTYYSMCEDVYLTLKALEKLGGEFLIEENKITFFKRKSAPNYVEFDVKESASTLRFLFFISCYLSSHIKINGSKSLFKRGIKPIEEFLKNQNIKYNLQDTYLEIFGKIKVDNFILNENISSQYITGYLFLLGISKEDKYIKYPVNMESFSYVEMSLKSLEDIGVSFINEDNLIKLNKVNYCSNDIVLEQDYSSLANFAVLGALKGKVIFENLNLTSLQGDKKILEILMDGRAKIDFFQNEVSFNSSIIKGQTISLKDCIDLGPILFVLASYSYGKTTFINFSRLIYKESNRLKCMFDELKKANVDINIVNDEVIINGKASYEGGYHFSSHNDHRICMALTIFSVLSKGNCIIDGEECVKKSYSHFFEDLFSLRSQNENNC